MLKTRGTKDCQGMELSPGRFMMKKIAMGMALWLIGKKPCSGYDLMREFKSEPVLGASFPARVYPILRDMVKMKLVKMKTVSRGKRESHIYSITPSGKKALKKMAEHMGSGLRGKFIREMIGNGGNAEN